MVRWRKSGWLPRITLGLLLLLLGAGGYGIYALQIRLNTARVEANAANSSLANTSQKLEGAQAELAQLKAEDQYKRNNELEQKIGEIEKTYNQAVAVYEQLLDLPAGKNKEALQEDYANSVALLAEQNYASAAAQLTETAAAIDKLEAQLLAAAQPRGVQSAPVNNSPPGAGFSRQRVETEVGTFTVSLVAADLNSTKVIVDTAADGDCSDACPVLALADYVGRNGAIAGINGSYFCPASYPSCAGKINTFDTLLMNKNKVYFNADNNVFSTVPAIIFSGTSVRTVGQSLEWGRDTGVDAVIANQGLLVSGGQRIFGGDGDPKKGSKGNRSFVGNKGGTVYIGVVYLATVAESAYVVQTLGLDNALNLDDGGSTALWSGGYKVGPGRNLPNAVLLVPR